MQSVLMDALHHATMRRVVREYEVSDGLEVHEMAALSIVTASIGKPRILDLGVGAGRTAPGLSAVASHYVGVDYVGAMVKRCRERFPDKTFEEADARDLSMFPNASFDVVFFSCNGICMVDHAGRLAILAEAHRLLVPGGFFVFSTCNRDGRNRSRFFVPPDFHWSANPIRSAVRVARFALQVVQSLANRLRYRPLEERNPHYAILNSRYHRYSTLLYHITRTEQIAQLGAAGFDSECIVLDLEGRPVTGKSDSDTLTFIARSPNV